MAAPTEAPPQDVGSGRSGTGRLRALWTDGRSRLRIGGGLASVAIALLLFSRVGIDGFLYRDEAIYAYGGQQMTHGVAPYVSIFDPKGPLATFLCGAAAAFAHAVGVDDLTTMRLAFFAVSVLTALAVYLLVLQLWGSVLGALTAAVVFGSFRGFAQDALRGPDAHSAGPLFAVLSMWLALRRQWFWAAFAASLASLVKQTYGFYTLVVILAAVLYSPSRRRQALAHSVAGALTPPALTVLYFAAKGALGKFWESAVVFPIVGLHRAHQQTIGGNVRVIARILWRQYNGGFIFYAGMVLLVAVALVAVARARSNWRAALLDPRMVVVGLTLVAQAAYLLLDVLSYDDLYQLLPYAAAGFGAVVALATRRLTAAAALAALTAGTVAALAALIVLSCLWFVRAPDNNHKLPAQRAMGCAINRIVLPGTRLYSLGDPVPLVLTRRRNPSRFIYLDSGVTEWKIDRTPDGFAGWVRQVQRSRASVVILQGWNGKRAIHMARALHRRKYKRGYVGLWRVYLTRAAYRRLPATGIAVTRTPTGWPRTQGGRRFTQQNCGAG